MFRREGMFAKIALFEFRYQLKNPVFWAGVILFFLLTFGLTTSDQISIGSNSNVHVNSPYAMAQAQLTLSLFFMFVSTAFVANVVVRDDETGYGPIVRATRVKKFDYLFGRYLGAFLAVAVGFLAVPLATFIGTLMPWVDPDKIGAFRPGDYAYTYFVIALPGLFLTSAGFFAPGHRHPLDDGDLRRPCGGAGDLHRRHRAGVQTRIHDGDGLSGPHGVRGGGPCHPLLDGG